MSLHRLPRLVLFAATALSAAAHAGPIECRSGKTEFLAGTVAHPGTHYSTATGMDVAAPARPEGWTLQRCNSGTIFFAHADVAGKSYVTAMVSDVGIGPWTDEQAFEAKVLDVAGQLLVRGQPARLARVLRPDAAGGVRVVPEARLPHLALQRLDAVLQRLRVKGSP